METCFFYYPCLNWRSNYFNNIKKTSSFICFNMKIHSCVFKLNFIFVFYYVVKLNSDHSNLLVWTLLETQQWIVLKLIRKLQAGADIWVKDYKTLRQPPSHKYHMTSPLHVIGQISIVWIQPIIWKHIVSDLNSVL